MDSLARSDIFFMVTTGAVIIVGILFVVAFVYVIRILRDARDVTKKVRDEAVKIADDVGTLRATVSDEVSKLRGFADDMARTFAQGMKSKRKERTSSKKVINNESEHEKEKQSVV
jgi:uncharacterized protein YoxC